MAAVVGITLVKKFSYRGDANEEFSNQYWLSGSIPSDDTAWTTLIDALCTAEKACYTSEVSIVRAYGYDSDADNAASVVQKDYSLSPIAGTLTVSSAARVPGDVAGWIRWKTSRLNTKGKPIFLRKYMHGVWMSNTSGGDTLNATQKTAFETFGTKLMDGTFSGSRTLRSRLNAETLLSRAASTYLTTRTLKRRGKRPA